MTAVLAGVMVAVLAAAPGKNDGAHPVCLVTDYGDQDAYVGALKGSVLQKFPGAIIHDLTHQLPPFDVVEGAFLLQQATATLPEGAVVVAVVDPGVGTARRPLAIRTRAGLYYIGPDNGLFTHVIREQGLEEARLIQSPKAMLAGAQSSTFHGRDIFGPAGGFLAAGGSFSTVGPVVKDAVLFTVEDARRDNGGVIGQVLHVDHYGNVVTNIPSPWAQLMLLADPADPQRKVLRVAVGTGTSRFVPWGVTYATVPLGSLVALSNSLALTEIAVNQGSAGAVLDAKAGSSVRLLPLP